MTSPALHPQPPAYQHCKPDSREGGGLRLREHGKYSSKAPYMKQGSVCPKTMSIIRRNVHFQTYTRLYFFAAVEHFPLLTHRQGNGKLIAENTLMAGICKGFVSCHSLIILFGLQQRFARLCEIPCLTAKSLPS